jgi:hypothetical protein
MDDVVTLFQLRDMVRQTSTPMNFPNTVSVRTLVRTAQEAIVDAHDLPRPHQMPPLSLVAWLGQGAGRKARFFNHSAELGQQVEGGIVQYKDPDSGWRGVQGGATGTTKPDSPVLEKAFQAAVMRLAMGIQLVRPFVSYDETLNMEGPHMRAARLGTVDPHKVTAAVPSALAETVATTEAAWLGVNDRTAVQLQRFKEVGNFLGAATTGHDNSVLAWTHAEYVDFLKALQKVARFAMQPTLEACYAECIVAHAASTMPPLHARAVSSDAMSVYEGFVKEGEATRTTHAFYDIAPLPELMKLGTNGVIDGKTIARMVRTPFAMDLSVVQLSNLFQRLEHLGRVGKTVSGSGKKEFVHTVSLESLVEHYGLKETFGSLATALGVDLGSHPLLQDQVAAMAAQLLVFKEATSEMQGIAGSVNAVIQEDVLHMSLVLGKPASFAEGVAIHLFGWEKAKVDAWVTEHGHWAEHAPEQVLAASLQHMSSLGALGRQRHSYISHNPYLGWEPEMSSDLEVEANVLRSSSQALSKGSVQLDRDTARQTFLMGKDVLPEDQTFDEKAITARSSGFPCVGAVNVTFNDG